MERKEEGHDQSVLERPLAESAHSHLPFVGPLAFEAAVGDRHLDAELVLLVDVQDPGQVLGVERTTSQQQPERGKGGTTGLTLYLTPSFSASY